MWKQITIFIFVTIIVTTAEDQQCVCRNSCLALYDINLAIYPLYIKISCRGLVGSVLAY